jgi:hypothetical protein
LAAYAGPFNLFSSQPNPAPAWREGLQDVQLTVVTDPSVQKPVLCVPRALLITTDQGRKVGSVAAPLVAGLALSAAFVTGGLWLAGRVGKRTLAVIGTLTILSLGTGAVFADLASPFSLFRPRPNDSRFKGRWPIPQEPPVRQETPVELPASITLPKNVQLLIVEDGNRLILRLPEKPEAAPKPIATSAPDAAAPTKP